MGMALWLVGCGEVGGEVGRDRCLGNCSGFFWKLGSFEERGWVWVWFCGEIGLYRCLVFFDVYFVFSRRRDKGSRELLVKE